MKWAWLIRRLSRGSFLCLDTVVIFSLFLVLSVASRR